MIENILDINTAAQEPREVKLTLKVTPTDNREAVGYSIKTSVKLASDRPFSGTMYVGHEGDRFVAYESNPQQQSLKLYPEQITKNKEEKVRDDQ